MLVGDKFVVELLFILVFQILIFMTEMVQEKQLQTTWASSDKGICTGTIMKNKSC
jgi:hypothetical protein